MTEPCPCDTGKPYPACCGRLHAGRPAPTAVALMRSRYSRVRAGSRRLPARHLAPHTTRPASLDLDAGTTWTGLVVEATEARQGPGTPPASSPFRVLARRDGDSGVLRERSRFALADGRWLYVDGTHS